MLKIFISVTVDVNVLTKVNKGSRFVSLLESSLLAVTYNVNYLSLVKAFKSVTIDSI